MEKKSEELLAKATGFFVLAFRGRGIWDRRDSGSLDQALLDAKELYTNRPIGIYVKLPDDHGEHLSNWEPERQ